jgi:hypothetical protein
MAKKGNEHPGYKHGRSNHHMYSIWMKVKIHCCERWKDIENFIEDMEPSYIKFRKFIPHRYNIAFVRLDETEPFNMNNIRWVTLKELRMLERMRKEDAQH